MQMIRLSEVLEAMDSKDEAGNPRSFDIRFVTASRSRGTGGEIVEILGARKGITRGKEGAVLDRRIAKALSGKKQGRDPRHYENATRNLILPNGLCRKISIWLILEFNHQKVIL